MQDYYNDISSDTELNDLILQETGIDASKCSVDRKVETLGLRGIAAFEAEAPNHETHTPHEQVQV